MSAKHKQIHLAAHFPGVNNTTVWSDPRAGSHIEFDSFVHLAQTAERAKFDFFFLAEGLRMREHAGKLHELDVAGRPDNMTVLAALAAVTDRIGLMPTITTTYHEPHELARQLASLDHLSDGRAGWNLVTSSDSFTGANFRRGSYLDYGQRYERGGEFVQAAWALWDSWPVGEPLADADSGAFLSRAPVGAFSFNGTQVEVAGEFTVPRPPQGHPAMLQAGDSDEGREFAAQYADGIFTRHGTLAAGRSFYADVKERLARYGRATEDLLILPGATFVLGDTDEEARELADHVRRQQVSGPHALVFLEQLWNRDLSAYDPDGPLPDVDPDLDSPVRSEGSAQARTLNRDAVAIAAQWRERAQTAGLSIRELVIEMTARQSFVGSPATVAVQLNEHVQADACDGFILVPYLTPGGLDRFAGEVVPLLQERGVFRADYTGTTLREHLGVPATQPGV
ncbi:MAG TPA: NtaA/DmoA family FMN-dependent monooxygenase [Solirubrobacteraceae bacterium]|nr:NtaA/DmoA family FMN-dependent monooxygenase [Solirubrobacteraceae bacterium]